MFLIWRVPYYHVLHGSKCAVNGLREKATLLKSSECVNLHGACAIYVQYMMYIIHTAFLNDFFPRNGKAGPGICCRSDAFLWLSWTMTKRFTSLTATHERKFSCAQAAVSYFDITVKVHIFLILGIFLYF
jgi:hypothetical protein